MQAVTIQERNTYVIDSIPVPICDENSFLLEIQACAVCGTDMKILHHGHKLTQYPVIPGHEFIGIIKEIGANILKKEYPFSCGDRVVMSPGIPCGRCSECLNGKFSLCRHKTGVGFHIPGGFTEYIVLPENAVYNFIKVPDHLPDKYATLMEPLACCIHGQKKFAGWGRNEAVVIIGAGAIGCLHAELARIRGAGVIIVIDIADSHLDLVKAVNPELHTVNSSSGDAEKAVREITGSMSADKVIVACSAPDVYSPAVHMLKDRGDLLLFSSLPHGNENALLDINCAHYAELNIHGTFGSLKEDQAEAMSILADHLVNYEKIVTHMFSLGDFPEAVDQIDHGKTLKVVITP